MITFSRSFYDTFLKCERRAYWEYLYQGSGVSPKRKDLPLAFGIAVHEGMATLLHTGGDVVAAGEAGLGSWIEEGNKCDIPNERFEEYRTLLLGLIYGWYRVKWNSFVEEYEYSLVEDEIETLIAPNIKLRARADALITERSTGASYVLNWKTSSPVKDWNAKWQWSIQTWTEAMAIQNHLGTYIDGCIYEGLLKGGTYSGQLTSPLVRGYKLLTPENEMLYGYKERYSKEFPWIKFNTGKEDFGSIGMGAPAWVSWLPEHVVEESFVRSVPILKDDFIVEEWLQQVIRYLTDVEHVMQGEEEADKLTFFKQKFSDQCNWCPFQNVCKKHTDIEAMLEGGILVPRVDHHGIDNAVEEE
jgi:CRISPR/Cas system-associated exonuclease Cas4 (RecB family)